MEEDETYENVLRKIGLIPEGSDFNMARDLGQWSSGWGHSHSSRFVHIYEKIEQLDKWS